MDCSTLSSASLKPLEFAKQIAEGLSKNNFDGITTFKETGRAWSYQSPATPFSCQFAGHANCSISIEGTVLQRSSSFTVNLSYFSSIKTEPNIAFHLNPRFGQNYVARNSRFEGSWDKEESAASQRFPFKRGEPFFMEIFLSDREFLVSINGFHFCSYAYRQPVTSIKWIEIFGGLKLLNIEKRHSKCFPTIPPTSYLLKMFKLTPVSAVDLNLNDQKICEPPLMAELTESFRPGYTLKISGRVKLLPHSFTINFQNGKTYWPPPLTNLHINARFNYSEKIEHAVILNSWLRDRWGDEQIPGFCPFCPGENFVLHIFCAKDAFEIIVNDELLAVYKYRAILGLIDTIYIFGDIVIDEITSSLEVPLPSIPNRT